MTFAILFGCVASFSSLSTRQSSGEASCGLKDYFVYFLFFILSRRDVIIMTFFNMPLIALKGHHK